MKKLLFLIVVFLGIITFMSNAYALPYYGADALIALHTDPLDELYDKHEASSGAITSNVSLADGTFASSYADDSGRIVSAASAISIDTGYLKESYANIDFIEVVDVTTPTHYTFSFSLDESYLGVKEFNDPLGVGSVGASFIQEIYVNSELIWWTSAIFSYNTATGFYFIQEGNTRNTTYTIFDGYEGYLFNGYSGSIDLGTFDSNFQIEVYQQVGASTMLRSGDSIALFGDPLHLESNSGFRGELISSGSQPVLEPGTMLLLGSGLLGLGGFRNRFFKK